MSLSTRILSPLGLLNGQPRLTCGLVLLGAFGAAVAYWTKRQLDQAYPRISVTALPSTSACRSLIETTGQATTKTAWGLRNSRLLASWPGGNDKSHWIPSFAALQVELPVALLAGYGTSPRNNDDDTGTATDASSLMHKFVAAFIDARAAGPERWLLDRDVPPLSFAPGSHLFGSEVGTGAFVLDTWSTARRKYVQSNPLPESAPQPVAEFSEAEDTVLRSGVTDAAGMVMYWRFPAKLVDSVDKAASYGLPWRLMQGGFQEFIVEKVTDQTARVTYVCVESADLHPRKQQERDFKRLPWLAYELHVFYAQILLYRALRRLRTFR